MKDKAYNRFLIALGCIIALSIYPEISQELNFPCEKEQIQYAASTIFSIISHS